MNLYLLSKQDRDALEEFGTVSLNQARDRLHTGRWSPEAFEAFLYLWELGPRFTVNRLPYLKDLLPGAKALVELHYQKAGPSPRSWRHLGMLQPSIGQRVEVRRHEDRKLYGEVIYAMDRNGPFWDNGQGRAAPPAWDEDLWRPLE